MTIRQITMTEAILKLLPWALTAILGALLSWSRLWGDDHFDTRYDAKYVKVTEYAANRTNDASVQAQRDQNIKFQLDALNKNQDSTNLKVDVISSDIKTLIRETRRTASNTP